MFFVPGNARQEEATVTYGDLIDLYESVMISADSAEGKQSQDLFVERMHESFPGYYLSRPKRFIETVQRIVAPTRPSLRGPPKLSGSPLSTYRKRTWKPRVPNPTGSSSGAESQCCYISIYTFSVLMWCNFQVCLFTVQV